VPHAFDGARPLIDWAVMRIRSGTSSASSASSPAGNARRSSAPPGVVRADDAHWRAVARGARPSS
jgi:hypothetical protein